MPTVVNPYAMRWKPQTPLPESAEAMGPQSQRRMTLQQRTRPKAIKRKYVRKTQLTVYLDEAFDATRHCRICRPRHLGLRVPKKPMTRGANCTQLPKG